ncbi:MAG: putative replication initiation protein [Bacteriophage sp.]|nr:MAG: putative replication initiation protein [Bacteriophage sp.]
MKVDRLETFDEAVKASAEPAFRPAPFRVLGRSRHNFGPGGKMTDRRRAVACSDPGYMHLPAGPTFVKMPRNCGKCAFCVKQKKAAFANACRMELEHSDWALFLTLTIAPGPERATDNLDKFLQIKVLQDFQKRCRINIDRQVGSFVGVNVTGWRYAQVGELGTLRGRPHYHMIVFGKGDRPNFPIGDRVYIPEWPFGHVSVRTDVDGATAFYIGKYIAKDHLTRCCSVSKVPALGSAYLIDLALYWATQGTFGLARDFSFSMPGLIGRYRGVVKGARRRDYIVGVAALAGRDILSYLNETPESMHASIFAAERWKREREMKAQGFDAFFERFAEEVRQKAALARRKEQVFTDEERERTINHLVNRGEYVPARLLPLPHAERTYEMDRAASRSAAARRDAVERAQRAGL